MPDTTNLDEVLDRCRNIPLVMIGKYCTSCEKVHRMDFLHTEIQCDCGSVVKFRGYEKSYLIQSEPQFVDMLQLAE